MVLLQAAYTRINRRPRATRGGLSANELEATLPHWRGRVARSRFYKTAKGLIRKETAGKMGRKARTAERRAIFRALARFGLAELS